MYARAHTWPPCYAGRGFPHFLYVPCHRLLYPIRHVHFATCISLPLPLFLALSLSPFVFFLSDRVAVMVMGNDEVPGLDYQMFL